MGKFSFIVAITASWVEAKSEDKTCKILSLRGGGVHGSYEAGVLKALVDHMPLNDLSYDYVSGVSIGAVNAAVFATFGKGEELEAAEFLSNIYEGSSSDGLFVFRSPLIIKAFTENSLTTNELFKDRIDKYLEDRPFKRKLSMLAADLLSG